MTSEQVSTDNMSQDRWLHALRTDPSPLFKAQLREQLREQEPAGETRREWPRRALVAAIVVIAVAVLSSVPAVRASVVQFASLFRVINVVGVPVSSNHLDRLKAENLQIDQIIGEHVEILEDPGPPVSMPSLADAAAAAGMTLEIGRASCRERV